MKCKTCLGTTVGEHDYFMLHQNDITFSSFFLVLITYLEPEKGVYYFSSLLHSDECSSHAIFHQACLKYCTNDTWIEKKIPCWTRLIEPSMLMSKVNGLEVLQKYILSVCFIIIYMLLHITNTFVDIIHSSAS